MSAASKIQWTDASWNPVRGCTRVSEGCRNCYAEVVAARFSGPGQPYEGLATRSPARWTGKVSLVEKALTIPLRWRKPRRIFVNSMSDLFHESLSDEAIDRVFAVMALCPHHTFQCLTKRPKRMQQYATNIDNEPVRDTVRRIVAAWPGNAPVPAEIVFPLPNLWLGVSIEDQATADERIPLLLNTPAAVRFLSVEPLLGPIDLQGVAHQNGNPNHYYMALSGDVIDGCMSQMDCKINWVIVGGESGPKARPMDIDWIRSIRDQCQVTGVPVFVKQLGRQPRARAAGSLDLSDSKGGDWSEWPEDLRVRQFPEVSP